MRGAVPAGVGGGFFLPFFFQQSNPASATAEVVVLLADLLSPPGHIFRGTGGVV